MNTMQQEEYDTLIQELEKESVGLIPMLQSRTYPEIIAKGDSIMPSLVLSVQGTTIKHYLTLMAVAGIDTSILSQIPVETRLKIYSDALKKGGSHNDWGLAGDYLSGASLDLVKIGQQALPYLIPFLDDTSAAGIWGSEEATINQQYQNRVCDFTYYLILKIIHRDEPYSKSPADRDVAIDSLKKYLKNKQE